jgi:AhpD family alkylhydroperoxidase
MAPVDPEMTMAPRLNPYIAAPELPRQLIDLANSVAQAGLERNLLELVKIRASQINGCAICLHMHALDARKNGETEERIYMLDAWRESPLYNARERAALAWTDALTRLADPQALDDAYQAVQAQFTEKEQVTLAMMIAVINSFNRLGVGFRLSHPVSAERQAA